MKSEKREFIREFDAKSLNFAICETLFVTMDAEMKDPAPEFQIYPEILEEIDKIRSNAVFNERRSILISYKGKPLNPKHAVFHEVAYIKNLELADKQVCALLKPVLFFHSLVDRRLFG
jgi:hypothetical protein